MLENYNVLFGGRSLQYIKTILGFSILFLFVTVDIIFIRLAIWKIRLRKSRRLKQRTNRTKNPAFSAWPSALVSITVRFFLGKFSQPSSCSSLIISSDKLFSSTIWKSEGRWNKGGLAILQSRETFNNGSMKWLNVHVVVSATENHDCALLRQRTLYEFEGPYAIYFDIPLFSMLDFCSVGL